MKTHQQHSRSTGQNGFITLVFLVLLSIMAILIVANNRTLFHYQREAQLLEQRQVQRLAGSSTNNTATAHPISNSQ